MKPINPTEAKTGKASSIPDFILKAVNELLVIHYNDSLIRIKQKDIIELALEYCEGGYTSHQIYENGWMDFESAYEKYGWSVEYDKPGWNETYDAVFEFTPKGRK